MGLLYFALERLSTLFIWAWIKMAEEMVRLFWGQ